MDFLPPLFLSHSLLLAIAIAAVTSPVYDAVARRRVASWLVALVVFYLVSFGVYGLEEVFFREVWPSFIPMISLGVGVGIAIAHRVVLVLIDRSRRK